MFNYSYKILFLSIMVMGTMVTLSANTWLGAWMGLEINLLSFIPLVSGNNSMSTESSLKYFLTQAMASTILLFTFLFTSIEESWKSENFEMMAHMLMSISLLIKLGAAPFHYWFPSMMKSLNWSNALILMTWQKLGPFMLMSYIINKLLIIICAIMCAIIGAVGGLAQTALLKLMAYSSINHMSWMLISMLKAENLWFNYFLFYSMLTMVMVLLFNMFNMFYVNHMMMLSMNNKTLKFILFMNLFSLGGLPPFLGFLPKWMVIQYLTQIGQSLLLTVLILMTLITLFFYMRLAFSAFMLSFSNNNWMFNIMSTPNNYIILWILSSISLMGLGLVSLTFNLF